MTLLYWEWHLIPRWLLRSIFARFSEQLLNGLVSIEEVLASILWWIASLEMLSGFYPASFKALFCSIVLGCRCTPLMDRVVSSASFLTGGVFECDLAHRRSMAVLCMLYKIRCNPMHPIYGALPVPYVPVRVTRGALIPHRYTYAPPSCRTTQYRRTFIPCQYLRGAILVTPYSLVWAWQVSRAGPMPFYWPCYSLPFCLLLFSLSLLSCDGLVLWGWGLWTDRVLIGLSQPSIANLLK